MRLTVALLSLVLPTAVLSLPHGDHHNHNQRLVKRTDGAREIHLEKRFSNSRWTFYNVGLGACGQTNIASDFVVALNSIQFGIGFPGPECFKNITMAFGGETTTATIVDRCESCPLGGLDLSRGLFDFFAPESAGVIFGEWEFVV